MKANDAAAGTAQVIPTLSHDFAHVFHESRVFHESIASSLPKCRARAEKPCFGKRLSLARKEGSVRKASA
jgi:hypothetical protein